MDRRLLRMLPDEAGEIFNYSSTTLMHDCSSTIMAKWSTSFWPFVEFLIRSRVCHFGAHASLSQRVSQAET
jgi:hypothetical protein